MAYLRDPTKEELARIQIPPCEEAPIERALFNEWRKKGFRYLGENIGKNGESHSEVLIEKINRVLGISEKNPSLDEIANQNWKSSDEIYAAAAYVSSLRDLKKYFETLAELGIY